MLALTERLLESGPPGRVLRQFEIEAVLGGTAARRYGAVNRALAAGELLHLRRGLYLVPGIGGSLPGSSLLVANAIVPGSYVSFESALSFHGWIPESSRVVLSAGPGRARVVVNALGTFRFVRIPTRKGRFLEGVDSTETGGGRALVASPLRALADLSYTRPAAPSVKDFLSRSMRIEMSDLSTLDPAAVRRLRGALKPGRVTAFLCALESIIAEGA